MTAAAGMQLFNSSLELMQHWDGSAWRHTLKTHMSDTYSLGTRATVTHTLGVKPVSFQMLYELLGPPDLVNHGYSTGDQIFVAQNEANAAPLFNVYDVTTTQYTVVFIHNNSSRARVARKRVVSDEGGNNLITVDNDPTSTETQAAGACGW